MAAQVLISGGGIAGLSLGFWLNKTGIGPVIVDRAPRFESLGHYISVKGNGVEVIRQMDLERECRAHEAKFVQLKMMTADGTFLRMGSRSEFDQTLGGYILLRRADLHEVIYRAVKDDIEIQYGMEIDSIREAPEHVDVTFSNGTSASFDLVVGADGIHSRTRKLVFGDGFEFPLGGRYIGLTQKYRHGLGVDHSLAYWGTGQMAALFPMTTDSVSAIFYYGDGGIEPEGGDAGATKRFLLEAYRGFAPGVRRVLEALQESDYVFMDKISQVRMPTIVKGRVVLVGDAAHCPTFMSGMGSSLALQGAHLLAQSIRAHPAALPTAVLEYESAIAPIAARYAASARQMRPLLLNRDRRVAFARNLALRVTPEWVADRTLRRFFHAENMARK